MSAAVKTKPVKLPAARMATRKPALSFGPVGGAGRHAPDGSLDQWELPYDAYDWGAPVAAGEDLRAVDDLVRRDALSALCVRASAIPRLSHEQVCALARRAHDENASESARRAARNTIAENYLLLVVAVARWYRRVATLRGLAMEDLVAEGMLGLLHAVDGYDPDTGNRFSTYAIWHVRARVQRYAVDLGYHIHVPVWVSDLARKVDRLQRESEATSAPLPETILVPHGAAGVTRTVAFAHAVALVQSAPFLAPVSLDRPADRGEATSNKVNRDTLGDTLADPATLGETDQVDADEAADRILAIARRVLSAREYLIFTERTLSDTTLEAVGRRLHITKERVRQLEGGALAKLRLAMGAAPTEADHRWATRQAQKVASMKRGAQAMQRAHAAAKAAREAKQTAQTPKKTAVG